MRSFAVCACFVSLSLAWVSCAADSNKQAPAAVQAPSAPAQRPADAKPAQPPAEAKSEPKSEPKPEPKSEPKPEPKPEANPAKSADVDPALSRTTKQPANVAGLQLEINAMREIRTVFVGNPELSSSESYIAMKVRLSGDKVGSVSRFGNLILTEVVDDQGTSLLDPNSGSEAERAMLRIQTMPRDRIAQSGIELMARCQFAPRKAQKIARIRGTVHLILADESRQITIFNPLQHLGKNIDDPRLKELGIEVRVVPQEELEGASPRPAFGLQYVTKPEHVQIAQFQDQWMRPIRVSERQGKTLAGDKCVVYTAEGPGFNDELQMILTVHPTIEDVQAELVADNVPLP